MNENTKLAVTAFIGIFIGALVTYLGVEKLTEKVIETSMSLGATKGLVDELQVQVAKTKKQLDNIEIETKISNEILSSIQKSDEFKLAEKLMAVEQLTNDAQGLIQLQVDVDKLKTKFNTTQKWPHAINCGSSWDALYILHGNPLEKGTGEAQYDQVFANEHRYVLFNPDGTYHARGGHPESSIGCENKSISQLRKDRRTYEFIVK